MKLLRLFSLIVGATLAYGSAQAADETPSDFSPSEMGNLKCSVYNAYQGRTSHFFMLSWVQGYLSGTDTIRVVIFKQKSILSAVKDNNGIIPMLNTNCSKESDNTLLQVSMIMFLNFNSDSQKEKFSDGQGDQKTYLDLGVGHKTCDFFNLHQKDKMGLLALSWFQGQLVGMDNALAFGTLGDSFLGKVSDRNELNEAFVQSCRANPSQLISTVGGRVFLNAAKKMRAKSQ
ncbi:hypothetical protein GS501_04410 [Saccharibacter sp. 17.LH.SD]|uniref:hypothetical protein n=1 Tax=Saccharibacter sp. 17.LH.SD TaxID=2689393 RepID=UPI0013713191|nr:hypothetical protein [Saccharibacter sp. 17.LH.SD]MXV44290.1 hypothetical protein [Saccharibacter sp. 17.LH.SD]